MVVRMNNFLNGLVKLFGFSDWGLTSLIYSIYLKRTKKISYVEEKTIKQQYREQFIKIRSWCYFMYFIIAMSLFINLNFTSFNRTIIWTVHIALFLCVFVYRIVKESKFYK